METVFIALAAVILTVAQGIPQAYKIFISKFPKAVSGFSVVFMVFGSLSWLLYGFLAANNTVAIAYSGIFLLSLFILLSAFAKAGVHRGRTLKLSLALSALIVLILLFGTPDLLGCLGGIASAIMVIPQGFKIIRQRETTGVSGFTYLLLALSSLCWIVYGHLTDNMLLILPNLVIFPTAAMVYFNILKYRAGNFFNSHLLPHAGDR